MFVVFFKVSMVRRFTLAGLLLWVALVALLLAVVVPLYRWRYRSPFPVFVAALSASADGSTFAALLGNGTVLVWDSTGRLKKSLRTQHGISGGGGFLPSLSLSRDGALAATFDRNAMGALNNYVAVWDIGAGKLLKTVPVSNMVTFRFLPHANLLAVENEVVPEWDGLSGAANETGGEAAGEENVVEVDYSLPSVAIELHSLTDNSIQSITDAGWGARFSPDGKLLALLPERGCRLRIRDATTLRTVQVLDTPQSVFQTDLAWSPDGQSLLLLQTHTDEASEMCWQTLEYLGTLSAEPCVVDLHKRDPHFSAEHFYQTATYLPGGRTVALAGQGSGLSLLDVESFKPLASASTTGVSWVAAGMSGDTFVTTGTDSLDPSYAATHVDLWDVATLRPRQRLFQVEAPNVWPAACGLVVWAIVFVSRTRYLRSAARARRSTAEAAKEFDDRPK